MQVMYSVVTIYPGMATMEIKMKILKREGSEGSIFMTENFGWFLPAKQLEQVKESQWPI